MKVEANFNYEGRCISVELPIAQGEVENILTLLGVPYADTAWRRHLRCLDGLDISYEVTGQTNWEALRSARIRIDDADFVLINLMMHAIDEHLNDDEDACEKVSLYMEATGEGYEIQSLINIILQKDEIYVCCGNYDGDTIEEKYAKDYFGEQFDYDYWDYVNFHSLGVDYGDEICFGIDYYIDSYNPGDVDCSHYSFEEVCNNYNWSLGDDEAAEIQAQTQRSAATASANKYRAPTPLTFTSQEVMDFILEGV